MNNKTGFSKKNSGPFLIKFCLLALRYMEMKNYRYDACHMTKMAAMPIYGKTLQNSSSPEPAGGFQRNLECSIGDFCPS